MAEVSISVRGVKELNQLLQEAINRAKNLRPAFISMAIDFYKSNREILLLKGPGQYQDLEEATKRQKRRLGYKVYPILKRTGRLLNSVTKKTSPDTVFRMTGTTLTLGSNVPYGEYHQSPKTRSVIPYRPFVINSGVRGGRSRLWESRKFRWMRILTRYIIKAIRRERGGPL